MPALVKNITEAFPMHVSSIPEGRAEDGKYAIGFARTRSELAQIQRLRYRVFNVELKEGLDSSHEQELDEDDFDSQFHHLYVRHIKSNQIVGTYRLQTWEMAKNGRGFYSATEFDFSHMSEKMKSQSIEIGRACISLEHRGLRVLYLLWKGLGIYAAHNERRYLFGCCSLTSQQEQDGSNLYAYLKKGNHLHPSVHLPPLESHACCTVTENADSRIRPPRLMRTYLSLGVKICSPPAIDRQFKTIDFLVLFDFDSLRESDLAFYNFLS